MTLTETRPEAEPAAPAAIPPPPEPAGLAGLLTTVDHKRLGRAWMACALVLMVAAAVVGEVLAVERGSTGGLDLLDADVFGQVYSFHAVAAVFLFLLPLLVGLAVVVVPLQVGARSIAFPRAVSAGFWGWLVSSGVLIGAYAIDGGPFGTDAEGVELWLLSLGTLVLSLLVATICLATTVLTMRAPGMTLGRTPPFAWSVLVGGAMWILTFPLLLANLLLSYLDFRYGQQLADGSQEIMARISWFFGQPQVYALVVPAVGIVFECVSTLGRSRPQSHVLVQGAIAVLAILGFGGFAQEALAPDLAEEALYVGVGVLALAPILLLVALVGDTLRRGDPVLGSPLLFSAGAMLCLLLGGAAGALAVIEPLDLRATTWESAQTHLVLLGAGVLAAFGGIHYWAAKIWGRLLSDATGKLVFAIVLLGVLLMAGADVITGALDQPLAGTRFGGDDAVEPLNIVAAIGGGLVILGAALLLLDVLRTALSRGEAAPADPWEGHTLEWATASPPSRWNFDEPLPEVTSEHPLLDRRQGTAEVTA